jgi:hypothetical protein
MFHCEINGRKTFMSGLFGGKTPKPEPAVRMPVPDDKSSQMAAERQRRAIAGREGRTSTVLSRQRAAPSQAGTSSYGNSLLGQAG